MYKQLLSKLLLTLTLSAVIISCDTLKKKPSSSSSRYSSSTRKPSGSKYASSRPSAKPASKTTSSRPPATKTEPKTLYTRPSVPYREEVGRVIDRARDYTGTPYRSGGNDRNGIDCSGLICSVYSEIGVKVPRISWQQSEFGVEVNGIKDIQPGDWVFFVPEAGKEGYVSHAGIVTDVRNDQEIIFIHASTSKGVREDNLFSNYFKSRFVKAMRPF